MKKILGFLFALLLSGSLSAAIKPPKGFDGKLWAGTLALYGTKDDSTHFLCTAEPIAKIEGGYRLLTAGHCVQDVPEDVQFSVADEIGGSRTAVTLVKAYEGDGLDFALFDLKSKKKYPVFSLALSSKVRVGDSTINPNFALGLGKQISPGRISSQELILSDECDAEGCNGKFLVQMYSGPGASGSAVFSTKTHQIIGLVIYQFSGDVGFAVEPISLFTRFNVGAGQPHPKSDAESKGATGIQIPDDIYKQHFGADHTFSLTVHGPDPKFTQAGYVFQVNASGFELSDTYYYDVPVWIRKNSDGSYALVSTNNDGTAASVGVTVLSEVTDDDAE